MLVPDLSSGHARRDAIEGGPPRSAETSRAASGKGKKPMPFGQPQQNDEAILKRVTQQSTMISVPSCPIGTAYYTCSNGFRGCANNDPCSIGVAFDEAPTSVTLPSPIKKGVTPTTRPLTTSSALASQDVIPRMSTGTAPLFTLAIPTIKTSSSILSSALSSKPTAVLASQVPSCPEANGTLYQDFSSISYLIRCNAVNIEESYASLYIGTGGYAQCFSSCSSNHDCAGFTYVGTDQGNCFFKNSMPNTSYVETTQSNYVSCAKYDQSMMDGSLLEDTEEIVARAIDAPVLAQTPRTTAVSHKRAIVGGSLGMLLLIALILLVFLLARRRHGGGFSHRLRRSFPGLFRYLERDFEATTLPSHSPEHISSPLDTIYAVPSPRQTSFGHARQRSIYTDHSGAI